ncbi:ubiquitin-protein ligase (E3) [Coemansia asiatica]|nr:ubiquitin-protein ligase (E3) [Coemansia asiatica]
MFGSFQGDFKRQRNINLGGSRRNETSRSNSRTVLNKAHEERQKREAERRRVKAAVQIQRLWRGLRDTASWRQSMREKFDISMLNGPIDDLDRVYDALVIFVTYYNCQHRDISTLHAVLRVLFEATSSSTSAPHFSIIADMIDSLEENNSRKENWSSVISMLLGLAMETYMRNPASIDSELLQKSLVRATNDSNKRAGTLQKRYFTLYSQVLLRLIEVRGLYRYLSRRIRAANKSEGAAITDATVTLTIRPFTIKETQQTAISEFSKYILSIPGLPNRLGTHGSAQVIRIPISWAQIAECVDKNMKKRYMDAKATSGFNLGLTAINTLGNMAAFVLPQLSQKGPITNIDFAFIQACCACAQTVPNCDLFDHVHSSLSSKSEATSIGARLVAAADPHALKWLNTLLSAPVLELLVRASCSDSDSGSDSDRDEMQVAEDSAESVAQTMLLVLTQRWGETASRAALDRIFQLVDIRTIGWRAVLSDPVFLQTFTRDSVRVETIKNYDLTKLQLLCELLNRQLQIIGDDELFTQGMSLPISDIKVIARACRNIAFALLWNVDTPKDLVHLRDTSASLTRQLFIRNARHQFVSEDFWLVPPSMLDMASFADKVAEDPIFSVANDEDDSNSDPESDDDEDGSNGHTDSESGSDSELDSGDPSLRSGTNNSRLSWLVSAYSGLKRDPRRYIKRASLTPRIAILRNIPFVVPFNDRVRLFHALINRDRIRLGLGTLGNITNTVTHVGSVFEDGFRQLFPVLTGKPVEYDSKPSHANAGQYDQLFQGHADNNVSVHGRSQIPHVGHTSTGGGRFDLAPQPLSPLQPDMAGEHVRTVSWPEEMHQDGHGTDPLENAGGIPASWIGQPYRGQSMWGPFGHIAPTSGAGLAGPIQRNDMFKRRMQIEFEDQYGMPEAGIDGGGVFKEFLTSLVHEAFDPQTGMFEATKQNNVYPSPEIVQIDNVKQRMLALDKFKFLGALIGKALYEGILVDVPFALFFLGRCMGYLPTFNDLPTLDEDLYRGLVALKNYPVSEISNGSSSSSSSSIRDEDDEIYRVFGMDFTVTLSTHDKQTRTVPLVPRGDSIKVTSHNRMLYLDLISQYKLVRQIDAPVKAFLSGLHTMIPEAWMRLLFATPLELSRLLCGDSGAINIADWKRNTEYEGAFKAKREVHPTIVLFWDVVENVFSEKQRRALCKFATSCERPPLLGFGELSPSFTIASSASDENGVHDNRLPSASTCVNLLKLPVYSSREILHEKLLLAIESGSGFDLS